MTFAAITNYSFDMSILEMPCALLHGMTLFLVAKPNPADIIDHLVNHRFDVLQLTPSRLRQIVDLDNGEQQPLNHLKVLLVGAEALSPSLDQYLKALDNTTVIQVYGPTEATVWSTCALLEKDTVTTVGKPLLNEQVFILDNELLLTPVGVPGEICIGGAGLARGYLNRPELTAEKFIPHPFEQGQRIYKTGDLGRWLPDGNIEFIGRKDFQVKIRGYRVELGEVESVLQQHPDIDAAVVTVKTDVTDTRELVAYIVSKQPVNVSLMHRYVSTLLPAYMVPTYFIQLEKLPLNANGKVNRKVLLDPGTAGLGKSAEYLAPRNEVEERLVIIWEEILGRQPIGVNDSFFESGGHSLKATRVLARVKKEFNIEIALRSIFSTPTIAALADKIMNDTWLHSSTLEENNSFEEIKI